jgi:hypothetical protein
MNLCQSVSECPKILKIYQVTNIDMGFQKKHVSGGSEDLDFFYRRVSREPPLKIQKKFDYKVEKKFFSLKYIFYLKLVNLETFWNLKSVFGSFMQLLRNLDLNQKADLKGKKNIF